MRSTCCTCTLTVVLAIHSTRAISLLLSPRAMPRRMSSSRGDSVDRGVAGAAGVPVAIRKTCVEGSEPRGNSTTAIDRAVPESSNRNRVQHGSEREVVSVQRYYEDRRNRAHARFKYTIDDKGLKWIKEEIERCLGFSFQPAHPYQFTSNGDDFGWIEGTDGYGHYTLFVENGRTANHAACRVMDGLREIARRHRGSFRLTPNQNLMIADVAPAERATIQEVLDEYGLVRSIARARCDCDQSRASRFQLAGSQWLRANATCPHLSRKSRAC